MAESGLWADPVPGPKSALPSNQTRGGLRVHVSVSAGRRHHCIFNRRMRAARKYEDADVHSPAFHLASGKMSGTSLPLCVQGSTVQSSLVLRSLIIAVLCGPSVNRNRDTGAAIVWCRSNLSWSRTSSSEFVLLVVSMQSN